MHHLKHETFPQLSRISGVVSASMLRRTTATGVEFLIVTTWQSMQAIKPCAGETAHVAAVPPAVQAMMVAYDPEVTHDDIVETYLPA
jgi:heme-degrading monooxygenase HmoA